MRLAPNDILDKIFFPFQIPIRTPDNTTSLIHRLLKLLRDMVGHNVLIDFK
jgi:hypothetical protein